MTEYDNYIKYEDKLRELCHDAKLKYTLNCDQYPVTLVIRPNGEAAEPLLFEQESLASSPEAFIQFSFMDDKLNWQFNETFVVSDAVLTKIKQLFKQIYACWTKVFFRNFMEYRSLNPNQNWQDVAKVFSARSAGKE